jgi:hypothetical protein
MCVEREVFAEARPGLPPRHAYRLTAAGVALAREQGQSEAPAVMGDYSGAFP